MALCIAAIELPSGPVIVSTAPGWQQLLVVADCMLSNLDAECALRSPSSECLRRPCAETAATWESIDTTAALSVGLAG